MNPKNTTTKEKTTKKKINISVSKKTIIGIITAVIAVIVLANSITIIGTNYTGVTTTMGQISDNTLSAGFHFKAPFVTQVHKCNNKIQNETYKSTFSCESSGKTTVTAENITVSYRIEPKAAVWFYKNIGTFDDLITTDMLSSALKAVTVTLDDTKVTDRNIIESEIVPVLQKYIDAKYGENKIAVSQVLISNIGFLPEYEEAIEKKAIAQKNAEEAEIENQKNIAKAEADAKVAKTKAEGERDAKLLEAEGNKALAESITPELNEYNKVQKWNGQEPQVVGGTGIVDFRSDKTSE